MAHKLIRNFWSLLVFLSVCIILREGAILLVSWHTSADSTRKLDIEDAMNHLQIPFIPISKWIVLDGVTSKCADVSGYTQNQDWGVIVVTGSLSEIKGCRPNNCFQLTPKNIAQHLGHLSTTRMLEKPSLISGYLLAISWGANIILDSDCSFVVDDIIHSFRLQDKHKSGLYYNQTRLFNPFQHIGLLSSYPISSNKDLGCSDEFWGGRVCLGNSTNSEIYHVKDFGKVSVRQGVMVTEKTCQQSAASDFSRKRQEDTKQPAVVLGLDTIAPLNTGPSLFVKDAFWWMFMPSDVTGNVSKFFRTVWLDGLKRSSLINVGFYPLSNSLMIRKSVGDLQCRQTENHLDSLNQTTSLDCSKGIECFSDLNAIACSVKVARGVLNCLNKAGGHFHEETRQLALVLAWMDDLLVLGVKESPRMDFKPSVSKAFNIKYGFNKQDWDMMSSAQNNLIQLNIFKYMSSVCPMYQPAVSKSINNWKTPYIEDIVLIIVINYESLFQTLPYLEYIHRQYFKYIIYCGPSVDHFVEYANKTGVSYVTYIDGLSQGWHFMYECVTHAMKLRLPVRGYLQIGDDILLNTWNVIELPKDQIWMPKGFTKRDLYKTKFVKAWVHWNSPLGQNATIKVFSELQNASSSRTFLSSPDVHPSASAAEFRSFADRFIENYKANIGMNFIIHRATDIFYIPEVLREDYIIASELFRYHKSLIEMAVPVMHLGLARKENVVYMKGASLWGEDRVQPWTYFAAEKKYFVHPFKSLMHLKTEGGSEFFCQKFLPGYESALEGLKGA